METIRAYLERKHEELRLLNDCLRSRLDLARPCSVDDVVRSKFQITAALRAEHELHEWKATETAWSHTADLASGPFEFSYDYQRADLTVRGPSFYEFEGGRASTAIYTASGMAAISAVLLASARIVEKADILVLPGAYGETLELIRAFVPHLRLEALKLPLGDAFAPISSPRILLLDSCSFAGAFDAVLRCDGSSLDLLIFDTTCFAGRSGRIRRVQRWARRYGIPLVLVRSHNKLDSLGRNMAGSARPFSCIGMRISRGQGALNGNVSRPKPETRCGCSAARRCRPTSHPSPAARRIGRSRSGALRQSCATAAARLDILLRSFQRARPSFTSPTVYT